LAASGAGTVVEVGAGTELGGTEAFLAVSIFEPNLLAAAGVATASCFGSRANVPKTPMAPAASSTVRRLTPRLVRTLPSQGPDLVSPL